MRHLQTLIAWTTLIASTAALAADYENPWQPKPQRPPTFTSPGVPLNIGDTAMPVVINIGAPYQPEYSPTADFSERVKSCTVSVDAIETNPVGPSQLPMVTGCSSDLKATFLSPVVSPALVAMRQPSPYCPAPCSASCPQQRTTSLDAATRLEHILEAAGHLDAAGMHDQAERVRALSACDIEAVLHRLKALEAELDSLRSESALPYECVKPVAAELPADHPFSGMPLGD